MLTHTVADRLTALHLWLHAARFCKFAIARKKKHAYTSYTIARACPSLRLRSRSMYPLRLTEAAGALVCGHVACSVVGISSAFWNTPMASKGPDTDRSSLPSPREAQILQVVSTMYCGGGLDPNACTADVTFTDQAACCVGKAEVCEAFRALRVMKPEHVEEPTSVSKPDGSTEVYLHQRYSLVSLSAFTIRSTLVVRTSTDGLLCSLEERWCGSPLLQFPAFRWARRGNGVLSSLLTPLVIR